VQLPDGDVIRVTTEPLKDPSRIEISLHTPARIDWWKGVQLFRADWRSVGAIETKDQQHDATMGPFPFRAVKLGPEGWRQPSMAVRFSKAKFLGAYTVVYRLDLTRGGLRYTFNWDKD
jgi:hypothetical protein